LSIESATAPFEYLQAYNTLLWEVVTSPENELAALATVLFEEPYINLPPPIQVAVFRLLGLEQTDNLTRLETALIGSAMYCSPDEELGATGTIRDRIAALRARGMEKERSIGSQRV
jgi:hypothetical protein